MIAPPPAVVRHAPADSMVTARRRIVVGGRTREYRLDVPSDWRARGGLSMVLVFHGGGGSPDAVATQTGFSKLAARVGAIVVYPAGSGRFGDERLLTWNTGTCCGYAHRQGIDEAAFVRAVIDSVRAVYPVTHVFAAGLSNGGMMTYLAACNVADRIEAIAVISGELSVECHPSRPVSVVIFHGTADENLPYDGGVGRKALDKHQVRPVSYAVDTWKTIDGCAGAPTTATHGPVTHSVWACHPASAKDATPVALELYTIAGGAHAWPGGERMARVLDAPSNAIDATSTAWSFFMAHERHGAGQ